MIYSGQLLNDSVQLKDVLRQYDDLEDQAFTVHLVCTPQKTSFIKSNQDLTTENNMDDATRNARNRSSSFHTQTSENTNSAVPQSQQRYLSPQYIDPRNNEQLAWMQQAYTHYFTQYMQL